MTQQNWAQGKRVAVVVLGDVGRSPRMQYHALALAESGAAVDLIGFEGSPLPAALAEHPGIRCHRWPDQPWARRHAVPQVVFLGYTALRILRQIGWLTWTLVARLERPDCLLVQTPPAVPALLLVWMAARLRAATMLIDWHNFGWSMLGLELGARHPVVRGARWYERVCGRRADAHLCVSRAMQAFLAVEWRIAATVLYDRPAAHFAPTPLAARVALFRRLAETLGAFDPESPSRPALVISATSWTADEDFSLVLDAVRVFDARLGAGASTPPGVRLFLVITGAGPLRASFEAQVARERLRHVRIQTAWLAPDDYPLLLGAADLGLCLHRSSSGLDLPMKVADMFGAGLPVCALDYGPCLAEQVRSGWNGYLFKDGAQLGALLYDLLRDFPADTRPLEQLRCGVITARPLNWGAGWRVEAEPVFRRLLRRPAGVES